VGWSVAEVARRAGKIFEFAEHSLDNGLEVKNQFDMCTQARCTWC